MGRAPDWDVRQHHNHCDTIAYSAIGRAHPSPREARGQEEGEAHQGGHQLHHYTPLQSFYLKKGVKPDGLDVVAKKVNSFT
jgi:hypothetical protein